MKARVTFTVLVLFWCLTLFSQELTTRGNGHSSLVSLIRVIANPKDFDGQRVKVVGFLAPGGGLDRAVGLFVSETDGRNFIVPNSIDLHVNKLNVKQMMGTYVALSGTYHAPTPGSGYNGYLDDIAEVKPLPVR